MLVGRKRLPFSSQPEVVLPIEEPEMLLDRPTGLSEKEKEKVPPIQKQSRIAFISDNDVELFVGQESEQQPHETTGSDQ